MKPAFAFCIVGLSGVLVNMGILWTLTQFVGFHYLWASPIAIEIAILNNFIWNDLWTFRARRQNPLKIRLAAFHLISIGGGAINWAILFLLTQGGVFYLISNLIGIGVAFLWNYYANSRLTWRVKACRS